jgi:ABC-type bacteriocin/lantibiotic exporter with double-glycine peptidase domain
MTIGMLVAFQSLLTSFMAPVTEIVGLGAELQEVEGEMNRLDDA